MSCNFKINSHRNGENLHLKLEGNFDGSSALQLINYLRSNIRKSKKIFIHTNCLKDCCFFGTNEFQKNFDLVCSRSVTYVFTGDRATQLEPQGRRNISITS